ncbi:hypothetical protein PBAT_18505 [Paenibacillus antarcticus]|uniref:Uncharacterized protein n=1 Tax=Paenibacillus antarcticus TaxID=253703 RepID=A0A168LF06_9BACL|nr:hypothetical protein PBAT_18505 [Paenibacillus antarcticus]
MSLKLFNKHVDSKSKSSGWLAFIQLRRVEQSACRREGRLSLYKPNHSKACEKMWFRTTHVHDEVTVGITSHKNHSLGILKTWLPSNLVKIEEGNQELYDLLQSFQISMEFKENDSCIIQKSPSSTCLGLFEMSFIKLITLRI